MGTLQQELLTKVQTLDSLRFDDDPNPPPTQEITMATSTNTQAKTLRQTYWEWLRDHPSSTAREMAKACGIDQTDAANTLLKFLGRGLVERVKHDGVFCYTTVGDTYPVLSSEELIKRMLEGRAKRARGKAYKSKRAKHAETVKSIEQRKAELIAPGVTNGFVDSVQTFINQLTVHQARAVYDELKKVFGG